MKIRVPLDNMAPNIKIGVLSKDQMLLLEYTLGIFKGKVNSSFAVWKIGSLSNSRWLILAARLMCILTRGVYHSELHDKPRQLLKLIIDVCMQLKLI